MKITKVQLTVETDTHNNVQSIDRYDDELVVLTENGIVMRYNMAHVVCYWEVEKDA